MIQQQTFEPDIKASSSSSYLPARHPHVVLDPMQSVKPPDLLYHHQLQPWHVVAAHFVLSVPNVPPEAPIPHT